MYTSAEVCNKWICSGNNLIYCTCINVAKLRVGINSLNLTARYFHKNEDSREISTAVLSHSLQFAVV